MGKAADLDLSPADTANELAKARARIAELEAKASPASVTFSNAPEIDAGTTMEEDENGKIKEVQWWFIKIDLPPSGGQDICINSVRMFHGEQYKVTTERLRTVKDIMARTWKHEDSISGSNENFYRRPQERTLRGNGR